MATADAGYIVRNDNDNESNPNTFYAKFSILSEVLSLTLNLNYLV